MTVFRYLHSIIFAVFLSFVGPVRAVAQEEAPSYAYEPVPFTEPVDLARGRISPMGSEGYYLTGKDACHLVTTEWAWERASCSEVDKIMLVPSDEIDTLVISTPNSEGYVSFEDWERKDRDKEIAAIWKTLVEGTKAQGQQLGVEIKMVDWLVYPTLKEENHYLYYATRLTWDGAPQINIKASKFDRRGYVSMMLLPLDANATAADIEEMIETVLASYEPTATNAYADFSQGDKVAAAGVLGVLATLVGVKYGKAAAIGLGALFLAFAKKLWILILVPLIALKNRLFKKKED